MHIRRTPQLISPSFLNLSDTPHSGSVGQPTNGIIDSATPQGTGIPALTDRGAEPKASPATDPTSEALAGEVVPHRLDLTYPDVPRPTPIKVQSSTGNPADNDIVMGDGTSSANEAKSSSSSGGDDDADSDDNSKEDKSTGKDVTDIAETISLPGLPLGMLGPVVNLDAPKSLTSSPKDDNDGDGDDDDDDASSVFEIMELPSLSNPMMDISAGPNLGDGIVEEIWITGTDDSDSSGDKLPGGTGLNPLDMLANELENMMGGIFGGKAKTDQQQPQLGQPIDEVMLPSGVAQKGPEVSKEGDAGAMEKGWDDMGRAVEIVMLSIIGPILAIAALGCGTVFLLKKMKGKRSKGYKEVQSGVCGDEEWN